MARARDDQDFMTSLHGAVSRRPSLGAHLLLLAIVVFLVWAVVWAGWAEIDQVTSGPGRVIPSRQVQLVQNLEGGILSEILVHEGDSVAKDQVVMQLDNTQFLSDFRENHVKLLGLRAVIERLRAEIDGHPLVFAEEVAQALPRVVASERALYESRAQEIASTVGKLEQEGNQRRRELEETQAKIAQLERSVALARQEIGILKPLVDRGINAPVELIRLRREENQYVGDLEVAHHSIERIKAAVAETEQGKAEARAQFRSRALKELNEAQVNAQALEQVLASRNDRVQRTVVRSPVAGTVKRIMVNTVGGVVQPGQDLMEIVPAEDALFVEARIKPADIAFLRPGLPARVKISAYDYTIYGLLPAELELIGADSILDEKTGESHYLIRVRTTENRMRDARGEVLPIIPGMTATVDVLTGTHTVLQYLLKPVLKVFKSAFHEH
ncbi:membrane fusion protein, adhesin transport system [Tistlia consotensis]|uniref:Membrane fusion protein (MFP) family protein n=1 Tax=Tistlia consotensis USBA 355 TaxID=560819 RepID=A0A1Y6B7K6_9PROT|nr:HlyD family type I secretion periplasmic adaptor subunit [Tistlia consotensis]SME92798.1 membrane fusion protein, adhesin transport system [Tistlia consotensis USBA 355]SNR28247.1 membrane fusion protein, adhesin transport system [Tistlia consotensis]